MGEWLLAIDVLAHLDGHRGDGSVHVVGCGDVNGIEGLLLLQHLAKVLIDFCIRVVLPLLVQSDLAHVAQSHNVFARTPVDVARTFSTAADAADIQLGVG